MTDASPPQLIVGLGIGLVAEVLALRTFRGLWTGANLKRLRTNLRWLPYSNGVREGIIRAAPTGLAGFSGLIVGLAAVAAGRLGLSDPYRSWAVLTAGLSLLAMVLAFVLMLLVIWFNVPKFLVPPPMRGDLGTISDWRRRRRSAATHRPRDHDGA